MIKLVATVVEADIDNPAFHSSVRKLVFSQGMMEAPGSHEFLELWVARDSNQRSCRKLRIVCALCLTHSVRVAFFRILLGDTLKIMDLVWLLR